MTPEHEQLFKWVQAQEVVEAKRRAYLNADADFNESKKRLEAIEASLCAMVPERGTRRFFFQGKLIVVSRKTGMGGLDQVYMSDVEVVDGT